MATIKDIAAKLNEGCSYSEVSKALGISKSTVSKYANRIKQSNLTLAQASECQEQDLYQFRTNPRRVARSRLCRRLSYLD